MCACYCEQWCNICMLLKHAYEIFYHSLTSDHWHTKIFIDVCYCVSDCGITIKWQNWKSSMSAQLLFSSVEGCYGNFWNDESSFWRADGNNTDLWVIFLVQEQCDWCWGCSASRMLIEGRSSVCVCVCVGMAKELVLKNSRVIMCEVLVCWEFHLGEFKAFGKAIWTYVRLLPDLCSIH